MADVVLSDGREITLDLLQMSISEYRRLIKPVSNDAEQLAEDMVISRVAGLTVDEFRALPQPDWRLVVKRVFEKAREPLADPN